MKLSPEFVEEVVNYLDAPAERGFPAERVAAMEEAIAFLGLRPKGEPRKTTDRKAETNRENAQKSTGPKSPAGKATSSKNRLSHGLCSQDLLVGNETADDFDLFWLRSEKPINQPPKKKKSSPIRSPNPSGVTIEPSASNPKSSPKP